MLDSLDPLERANALDTLDRHEHRDIVDFSVKALIDPAPEVCRIAALILQRRGPGGLGERLLTLQRSSDEEQLARLDSVLPLLREAAAASLRSILESDQESPSRQAGAALLLGAMGDGAAAPLLARRAWVAHPGLALAATQGLLAVHDAAPEGAFDKLARHPLPEVRLCALEGIVRRNAANAVEVLAEAARGGYDTHLGVRQKATLCLGETKDARAIPLLIDLMQREHRLRSAAATALQTCTGLNLGGDPYYWSQWYYEFGAPKDASLESTASSVDVIPAR